MASYHSSLGSIAKEALQEQRVSVNKSIREFHDYFQTHTITPEVKTVMTFLTKIIEVRQSVDNFSIDFNKMFFEYYSQINSHLLKELETVGSINTNSVILYQALWIVLAMVSIRLLASFFAFHTYLGIKGTLLFSLSYSMPLTFLVAIATIAAKNGAIGQEEYASFIVAALIEGIVIMTLIQFLMYLFKRFETQTKEKIG